MKKRVLDHIRDRLLRPVLNSTPQGGDMPCLDSLRETENHREVWALCDNRMLMGAFRYELMAEKEERYHRHGHVGYDLVHEAQRRIGLYEQDGNTEHLLDAINMTAIEFRFPTHPNAHFEAQDDVTHAKKRAAYRFRTRAR